MAVALLVSHTLREVDVTNDTITPSQSKSSKLVFINT